MLLHGRRLGIASALRSRVISESLSQLAVHGVMEGAQGLWFSGQCGDAFMQG